MCKMLFIDKYEALRKKLLFNILFSNRGVVSESSSVIENIIDCVNPTKQTLPTFSCQWKTYADNSINDKLLIPIQEWKWQITKNERWKINCKIFCNIEIEITNRFDK